MGQPEDKSCYVVELSVGPGGSRWAELHAYTEPLHLKYAVDIFCGDTSGTSAYHGIWYGAILGIWTIQRGVVADFLDLHPFIKVTLGEKAPLRLSDNEACGNLVRERRREILKACEKDKDEDEFDADYHDVDQDVFAEIRMEADWEAIAAKLPPLEPPLLQSGERAKQENPRGIGDEEGYFFLDGNIRFGSYECENGETLPGPVPFQELMSDPDDEEDDEDDEDDEAAD